MTGNLFENTAGEAGEGWHTAWCDGGSRGNPGPSGYGAVIQDSKGATVARLSQFLGVHTNNYAEYQGMLAVLEWARAQGIRRLRVFSDSELMVKQMKGQYKVASPALRPLWEEAKRRVRQLEGFEMQHTLRGGNKEADKLANDAMDRGTGKGGNQPSRGSEGKVAAAVPVVKSARQVLDGYVKNGVIHLLEGSLPEGSFVKVIKD